MPIYTVQMWFQGMYKVNVEAEDEEGAEYVAIRVLHDAVEHTTTTFEVNDAIVTQPSNQYTDQQELEDRERGHEQCSEHNAIPRRGYGG